MNEVPPFHPNIILHGSVLLPGSVGSDRKPIFPYIRNDQGEGPFPEIGFTLESTDPDWKPGDLHQFNADVPASTGRRGRGVGRVRRQPRAEPAAERNLNLAAVHSGCVDDAERGVASAEPELHEHHSVVSRVVVGLRLVAGYGGRSSIRTTTRCRRSTRSAVRSMMATSASTRRQCRIRDNPRLDHAISSRDRTHVLRLNGMYELPRLQDKPAVVRLVVGGWRLAGIMSYLSGNAGQRDLGRRPRAHWLRRLCGAAAEPER